MYHRAGTPLAQKYGTLRKGIGVSHPVPLVLKSVYTRALGPLFAAGKLVNLVMDNGFSNDFLSSNGSDGVEEPT